MPPILLDSLMNLTNYSKFILLGNKEILKRNEEIKKIKSKDRAFLLATGPSLKNEDLTILKGEDCFSVSNFFLHNDVNTLEPKLHFFAPYHPPLILDNYIEWLEKADKSLPKSTNIVLGHTSYDLVAKYNLFPNRKIYYLYLSAFSSKRKIDLKKRILGPQSGPLMILPVLLYMNYKTIYLLGCDHTILRDFKKNTTNFYDKKRDIRINATSDKTWGDISHHLKCELNVFEQYKFYNRISGKTSIINLSSDSWLDVFKKEELSKIFLT